MKESTNHRLCRDSVAVVEYVYHREQVPCVNFVCANLFTVERKVRIVKHFAALLCLFGQLVHFTVKVPLNPTYFFVLIKSCVEPLTLLLILQSIVYNNKCWSYS